MGYSKSAKAQDPLVGIIKAVLVGDIVGVLVCALLLFITSFLFVQTKNMPNAVIEPLTIGIAGIGAFCAGYISARVLKNKGMFLGMSAGFILFAVLFISGLIIAREALTMVTVIKLLLLLLMGAVGGIIGVNKRNR